MGATNECQCGESKKQLGTYVCGDKCINKDKVCEKHSDCKVPEKTENSAKLKYLKYKMKYIRLSKELNESSSLNFVNKEPLEILEDLKKEIGEPSIQSNKLAYLEWDYNDDGYRHVLRDEAVAHCVPAPHIDFLYTFFERLATSSPKLSNLEPNFLKPNAPPFLE